MKVKEIMTAKNLKHCGLETKLVEAVKLMKDANCGALPVLDNQKKVIGMVTDRDIALSLAEKPDTISQIEIGKIISGDHYTVRDEEDIWVALKQMRTHKIGRLPVVDEEGKLKGIISMHNLLIHHFEGELELGKLSDKGENILKTVKAIDDRYKIPQVA